jgi:Leu/Phe-tRNA-protein transferase
LIISGFIVLSQKLYVNSKCYASEIKPEKRKNFMSQYFMTALIFNKYPVLFLEDLHEPRGIIKKINGYELKVNSDFDLVIDKCREIHGEIWLSEPLINWFKMMHRRNNNIKVVCFGVYRNGILKAGEFGIIIGEMYFSYSGYHEESSAGTIQMLKMFRYLKDNNFICCILFGAGETHNYKYRFGTIDINREEYIKLFRELKNKGAGE